RSFELDRVDDQVRTALPAVAGAMRDQGAQPGPPRGGPPPGGAPGSGLPPGSYGELRDASGSVIDRHVFDYDQDITADPKLPRDIPLGRVFTVKGENGDANSYRVYAARDLRGGGITVAAAPLGEIDDRLNRLLAVESLVIAAVLVVLGLVAWAVVRVGLLPLDRMGHTAGAIAGGDLSHRVESTDPRTEVGRLGIALNAMLDRLEHAFSQREASENRLRRFLADASHELRTPLASIRGYAELFRMGAASDPEEAARAMRRIEDEAARMGVLVEDLLTLARLDEIAEAPHREIDLGALAEDAVSDARVTAPDREITLAAGAGTTVLGDAHQLRQVLANLMRNALVHTPAGTGIDVSVANGDGRVRLIVRDHGPGLPTEDPDALFERFWRAEGGRERGRAGAGLGLAIVAAIVDAHGGSVGAANAPDGGAVFSVELPVHAG
ncbi:MAG TPA: HAMP domain-containing sensor histidine kinase, partial [Solirubrobacteraceae bacterium]|nr:HAMP domain-containing sensor histidine kinase [Solirubrobacteraceae bacterium]